MAVKRLEIGPGQQQLYGFDTLDCVGRPTFKASWGDRWPIEDNAYDEVYTSHSIEHCPHYRLDAACAELHRVLKPGGTLEIWTVDFAYVIQCYHRQVCGDDWRRHNPQGDFMRWVNGRLYSYSGENGYGDENFHRSAMDYPFLVSLLTAAGFRDVARIPQRTRGINHGAIDLGVTATA